jgi:hypothetical protein
MITIEYDYVSGYMHQINCGIFGIIGIIAGVSGVYSIALIGCIVMIIIGISRRITANSKRVSN